MKIYLTFLASLFCFASVAHAQLGITAGESVVEVNDSVLGVEIKMDKSGRLLSVKSSYTQPVEFPDRRGINTSYIIAEEKAKAQLIRFGSQESMSSRKVNELESQISKATQISGNASGGWTKDNTRTVTTNLNEVTGSFAAGNLKGVTILERTYDEKKSEVTVVVGINGQTAAAAAQLRSGNFSATPSSDNGVQSNGSGSSSFPSQGSETVRGKNFNSF